MAIMTQDDRNRALINGDFPNDSQYGLNGAMNDPRFGSVQAGYPMGREISRFTLEAMGLTPGDVGEVLTNYRYDTGLKAGGLQKLGWTMEHDGESANDERVRKKQEEEQRRQIALREQEQQQLKKHQEQLTWEEKQAQDKKIVEQRAQDEKANQRIIGATLGFALFPVGLGLSANAMSATAGIMSAGVAGIAGTTMVTSNNNGGMLAELRGALGMGNPMQPDRLVTAPNMAATFIPGQTPASPPPAQRPDLAVNAPSFAAPAPTMRA